MSNASLPQRKGPSGPKAPPPPALAPLLFSFDVTGGPVVPPGGLSTFGLGTDSFRFEDVGECFWTATIPQQEVSVQFIVDVFLAPPSIPGSTCGVAMVSANIDDTNAEETGPFRLVLALYPKPATPGNIIPP